MARTVNPPSNSDSKSRDMDGEKSREGDVREAREAGGSIAKWIDGKESVEIRELDKAGVVQRVWVHGPDHSIGPTSPYPSAGWSAWSSLPSWRRELSDAFLPVGFPYSVTSDYLAYQTFDSLQAFFSAISSMLANRALLEGLGVGDANSSATYAILVTVLKDGVSRVATILFAHKYGIAIEPECKKYRFLADVFNDSAFFLDLFSPGLGSTAKLLVLGTGECLRALCGVAAGASKAALSSHFAIQDNLAELNAKEASQETAIGLLGLLVGTVVVKLVEDRKAVFVLMVMLVLAHLWMNYLGVRSVVLQHLNRQRATILFRQYLSQGTVMSPSEVAKRERIITWMPFLANQNGHTVAHLSFAKSYAAAMRRSHRPFILEQPMFIIFVSNNIGSIAAIRILILQGADPVDLIKAWFMAVEIAWYMTPGRGLPSHLQDLFTKSGHVPEETGSTGGPVMPDISPCFDKDSLFRAMEDKGWDLATSSFETGTPVRLQIIPPDVKSK